MPANNSASFATQVDRQTRFYAITPCRLVDTRRATGTNGGPILAAGAARTFAATGAAGGCGIPTTAWALSVNAVVTQTAGSGVLKVFSGAAPQTAMVNFSAGKTRGNSGMVGVGDGGTISALSTQATHLVLDVSGYFE